MTQDPTLQDDTAPSTGDPAEDRPHVADNASLVDALRLSFRILQLVIIALLIGAIVAGGLFYVRADEVAVRTRFGRITGDEVLTSEGGPYFSLPAPIDRVIRVPTSSQTLQIQDAFWFNEARRDPGTPIEEFARTNRNGGLDPAAPGGALLTGDGDLVHGRFVITWRVQPGDAVQFVRSFAPTDTSDTSPMPRAEELVRVAAEQAITDTVAGFEADPFVRGLVGSAEITQALRDRMIALDIGITIDSVTATGEAPLQAYREFYLTTTATNQRDQAIEDARRYANRVLTTVAGEGRDAMLAVLDAYEQGNRDENAALVEAAEAAGQALLSGAPADEAIAQVLAQVEDETLRQRLQVEARPVTVGGVASAAVTEAQSYRTEVVNEVRGDVDKFRTFLAAYRDAPQLTKHRLYRDMLTDLYTTDKEMIYLRDGDTELVIPRDATIDKRRREEAARRAEAEAALNRDESGITESANQRREGLMGTR